MVSKENPKTSRINWDELFMNMAILVSKRAACKFYETGSVYVDQDHRIISTGYNGPTTGDVHCIDVGCAKVDGDPETGKLKKCRGAHGEINGIINCHDSSRLKGSTIYTVIFPCYDCMKALNNSGITEIVYLNKYIRIKKGGNETETEDESLELALKRNIKVRKYEGDIFINI